MVGESAWNDRLARLNDLLADLYPDESAARRVIIQAGLPAAAFRFHPAASINWFNILEEAQRRDQVDAIVRIARADFPQRREWTGAVPAPPLDTSTRERLHGALLAAFPTEGAVDQLLIVGMNVARANIAAGSLSDVVFQVIRWAEASGRVDELISAASAAQPDNPALSEFVRQWRAAPRL